MFRFQDRVFLKHADTWYVWESHWDSFRPIDAFAWNGTKYVVYDVSFTKDPFSELFGYGTPEQLAISRRLTEANVDKIESAPVVTTATIGDPIWARDRWAVMAPSAIGTWRTHLTVLGSKARTCKRQPRGKKVTKRVILSDKRCASTSS
jgi:hypothetical protein